MRASPISIKDLFDVRGEATLAGSTILRGAEPAARDAAIVRRLRVAGAAIIGKTNMTEFAFSGLGINPHYGTPANPWRRSERRIPGGSSSGAAVSITDGMATCAIGTDTGVVRLEYQLLCVVSSASKPTASTVPTEGAIPLSRSFDSIGLIAADVSTCATVYNVLSGRSSTELRTLRPSSIVLGVMTDDYVMDQVDETVANAYQRAISRLSKARLTLQDITIPALHRLPELFEQGGLVAGEAFAWHRRLINRAAEQYDPRVISRIRRGQSHTAAFYLDLLALRDTLIAQWIESVATVDALVMPTDPIAAPSIDSLQDNDAYTQTNLSMLRNPTVINAFNGCAISLPCHEIGEAPVGLMIAAPAGHDQKILEIANTVAPLIADRHLNRCPATSY